MVGFGTNSEVDRTCECSAGTASPAHAHLSGTPDLAKSSRILAAKPPRLPESASPDVTMIGCPPEAVGAVCGHVKVPLDRTSLAVEKIRIYFELYPHLSSGPAESAILGNFGGPGETTTGDRSFAQLIFGPNMDVHDLLLQMQRTAARYCTIRAVNGWIARSNWGRLLPAATGAVTSPRTWKP